jgi:hypothetical protein
MSQVEALPDALNGASSSVPATTFSEVLGALHQSESSRARTSWRQKYWRQFESVEEGCELFVGQVKGLIS